MEAPRRAISRARLSPTARALAPALVFLVGVLATGAGYLLDVQRTSEQRAARVENAADRFSSALAGELDRYADAARAMRVAFEGDATPTEDVYAGAADQLDLARRYPALTGLNAVLPEGNGLAGPWRVTFVAPRGPNRAALGFDIRDNPLAEQAAALAADTGLPAMTAPITLAQETGDALGFVIYVPFYDQAAQLGSVDQRRVAFRGWTQSVFRGPDVIDAVAELAPGMHVTVYTEDELGARVPVTTPAETSPPAATERTISRFGRTWQVVVWPDAVLAATGPPGMGRLILGLGLPVTLLLTALVLALARSDRRATSLVAERTAELQRREERFRTLTATSPTGTFELDASGAPSYANAQLTSMLGWSSDDDRSAWRGTIHDDDVADFEGAWQELVTRDRPVAVSLRVNGPDAALHHVRMRIVPLHHEHSRVGFIGTVEDLSAEVAAQSRAERALDQARERAAQLARLNDQLEDANTNLTRTVAERDELTAIVAHDVRAPLTVIGGFAHTIDKLDGPRLSEVSRDFLQRIVRQTNELEALVDDLVLGSRLGAGAVRAEPGIVDLAVVASQLAQDLIGPDAKVGISGRSTVVADERHVRRVLANLLSNARKYGGAPVAIAVEGDDDTVVIHVADHGPGIPPEVAQRLFQRFAGGDTADVEPGSGAGLGLSIVADLVRLNGGTVTYADVEPHGARFSVRLPAATAGRSQARPERP